MNVAASVLTSPNFVIFDQTIAQAFPDIDPGLEPFGVNVILQIKYTPKKTKGGIIIAAESRSTEQYNTQTAKVIAMGPMAFKTIFNETAADGSARQVIRDWPDGAWFSVGEFVRVPKYGGDRWSVSFVVNGERDECIFAMVRAKDVLGRVKGDPTNVKAFLD